MDLMTTELSDAAAIAAACSDPDAFTVVFERHFDAIHRYLCARVGDAAGDELAAEVFLRAFDARGRYEKSFADARPWLFGIAINLVHRRRRDERRQLAAYTRVGMPPDHQPGDADVHARVDARRLAPAAADALARLATRDRDALLLHVWGELTYEQVAQATKVPVGTVRSRINRARTALRAALDIEEQS
jgi:RNA polymerase sigma factor (sigma-70 family)